MPSLNRTCLAILTVAAVAGLPLSAGAQAPTPVPTPPPAKPAVDPHGHAAPAVDQVAANFPLKFDATTHDFGDIPDTERVSHTFKFVNSGEESVTIASVNGSCGCTAGTLVKNEYAPGESGEITATFDPTNRQGVQPKTLTVSLKDGRSFVLHLSSNVKPWVYLDNQKLQFMEMLKGTTATQGFTVIGRAPDFRVEGVDVSNPDVVTVEMDPVETVEIDGEMLRRVNVRLTNTPTKTLGFTSTQLTIRTNDTHKPTLQAVASVQTVGELRPTPMTMYIRQNQPGVQFETEALLDNRLNKPFEITTIDVEGPTEMQLVADFSNNPNGPGYLIRLSGVTPPVPGQFRGSVIVNTDVPDEQEMRFQFFCNVFNPNGTLPAAISAPSPAVAPTVGASPGAPINPPVPLSPSKPTVGGGH
jgi:hypothetical protein